MLPTPRPRFCYQQNEDGDILYDLQGPNSFPKKSPKSGIALLHLVELLAKKKDHYQNAIHFTTTDPHRPPVGRTSGIGLLGSRSQIVPEGQ